MKKAIKSKKYSPLNEENITKAIGEISKEQYIDLVPVVTSDEFYLFYTEQDKAAPSSEDVERFNLRKPHQPSYASNGKQDWVATLTKYKIQIGILVVLIGAWWFYFR